MNPIPIQLLIVGPATTVLILNSKDLVVQVLAVTGLEGLTVCQLESSPSIRFSFATQENDTFRASR